MTGPEHYQMAELLLGSAPVPEGHEIVAAESERVQLAQVHAVLALTAALAILPPQSTYESGFTDYEEWHRAAGRKP